MPEMSEPKRFYDLASMRPVDGGYGIFLDERRLKTPAKGELLLPSGALAHDIAAEWNGQGAKVDPRSMPLSGLANAAIDRIAPEREAFGRRLAAYGGHDLLCYRAADPVELAARQAKSWQPLLDWLEATHGARLALGEGVVHVEQLAEALAAQERAILTHDPFRLAALHVITVSTGSLALGLATLGRRLMPFEAFELSRIDEEYQIERWGRDAEADARAEAIRREIETAGRFLDLLR
jgi:chaperone required for assembly of F1-ATPase